MHAFNRESTTVRQMVRKCTYYPCNFVHNRTMKIIDAIWFTEMGSFRPIGIVIGKDEQTNETKAYIGTAFGNDEAADAAHIAAAGARLHPGTAMSIATRLAPKAP